VGRAGVRRRKKVRHLPKVEGPLDASAFGTEQSLYTVEGRIAATGRLARGLRDASPTQLRFVGRLFAACIGSLVLLAIIMTVVGHFVG
jgi:hypothetical protein